MLMMLSVDDNSVDKCRFVFPKIFTDRCLIKLSVFEKLTVRNFDHRLP